MSIPVTSNGATLPPNGRFDQHTCPHCGSKGNHQAEKVRHRTISIFICTKADEGRNCGKEFAKEGSCPIHGTTGIGEGTPRELFLNVFTCADCSGKFIISFSFGIPLPYTEYMETENEIKTNAA